MKQNHYHISLYIIIPAIFSGYALLSSILSYRLTQYCAKHGLYPGDPVFWLSIIISIVGFVCGLAIVWVILKPVESFIEKARQLASISNGDLNNKKGAGQLEQITRVFEQVTTVLSMVDARQLFPEIIAESKAMRGVLGQIIKVASTDSTVLILGESGTGKELVATSIYRHSNRKTKPFIKFNCTAVPDTLWESELFGHEKGSFTGATARKLGKFEMANGGTIFLDEIGDMPLETQAKILRVLQEREFERVGGNETIKVDVRFIAATNKDLKKMVEEKKFREDLYFRLNVFYIHIPPLRERPEDIPILAEYFCKLAPKPVAISPIALQLLTSEPSWHGNIRELQNVIERASVMCESGVIEPRHLPESIIRNPLVRTIRHESDHKEDESDVPKNKLNLDEQIAEIEKAMIIEALRQADGVQVRAAEILGIKQRSLWHKIHKFKIEPKTFRKN
jgi:transcriptional regulator with GAF, ATPase, and Fis domain